MMNWPRITSVLQTFLIGFVAVFTIFAVVAPAVANAAILPEPHGKCPEDYLPGATYKPLNEPCDNNAIRDFSLDDFKRMLRNIQSWLLKASGAIALFMFVLGGFLWVASAGNEKMITIGKSIMQNTVIGVLILFLSFTAIQFILLKLLGASPEFFPSATPVENVIELANPSITKVKYVDKGNASNPLDPAKACTSIGGKCGAENTCKTAYSITNICTANQECCVEASNASGATDCSKLGGQCLDSKVTKCGGIYVDSLCGKEAVTTMCCFTIQ